jgi:hypothetical protein
MALVWVKDDPWAGMNLVLMPAGKQCAHIGYCLRNSAFAADMLVDIPLQYFHSLDEAKAYAEAVYALEN